LLFVIAERGFEPYQWHRIANSNRFQVMKKFLRVFLSVGIIAAAGCSRSDEKTVAQPQSTPDAQRLKSDSERLQQATANAAKEREKTTQATPTPSPTP
jgi:hypothetical protein